MVRYLSTKERIKLKWYFPLLERSFILQRKNKNRWKTVSSIQASIVHNNDLKWIINWLRWKESAFNFKDKSIEKMKSLK